MILALLLVVGLAGTVGAFGGPPRPKYSGVYLWEGQGKLIPLTKNNKTSMVVRVPSFAVQYKGVAGAKIIFNNEDVSLIVKLKGGQDLSNLYLTEMEYSKYEIATSATSEKIFCRTECYLPVKNIGFLDPRESDEVKLWDEEKNIYQLIPSETLKKDTVYCISRGCMAARKWQGYSFTEVSPSKYVWSFQIGESEDTTREYIQRFRAAELLPKKLNYSCERAPFLMQMEKEVEKLVNQVNMLNADDVHIYRTGNKTLMVQVSKSEALIGQLISNYSISSMYVLKGDYGFENLGAALFVIMDTVIYDNIDSVEELLSSKGFQNCIIQQMIWDRNRERFLIFIPASNFNVNALIDDNLSIQFLQSMEYEQQNGDLEIKETRFISSKY